MKRLLKFLLILLVMAGLVAGGVALGLFWEEINPFGNRMAEQEALQQWLAQLQRACTNEEALRGIALRPESIQPREVAGAKGSLTLTGIVARQEQIPLVEARARTLLEQFPRLAKKYPDHLASTGLQVLSLEEPLARLQADFHDGKGTDDKDATREKRLVLNGTRLDQMTIRDDGKLIFHGVLQSSTARHDQALAAVNEGIRSRLLAYGARAESLPDVLAELRRYDPPRTTLQKIFADEARFPGVHILASWYQRDGKLHVEGLLGKEEQRKPVEAAIAAWLQTEAVQPLWKSPAAAGASGAKYELKLTALDADARVRALQAELVKTAQKENKPYLQRVRLDKVTPQFVAEDRTETEEVPPFRFVVSGRYLESGGDGERLRAELPGWLQQRLPRLIGPDRIPITPKLELAAREDPVEALQRKIIQRGMDGTLITEARYDAVGRLELHGRLSRPGAKFKEELREAFQERLVAEAPWTLDTLQPHVARANGQAMAWSDVLKACQARLAQSAGAGQRSRLDRLYFRHEGGKRRLDGAGVFLAESPEEAPAPLEAVLDQVISSRSGATALPTLYQRLPAPLVGWQQKIAEQTALDGTLLTQLRYDADGTLQIDGYLGAAEQKVALRNLLTAQLALFPDALRTGAEEEPAAWSMAGLVAHRSLKGKDRTWSDILHALQAELAASEASALRHMRLDQARFVYRDQPRRLTLQWHATRLVGLNDQAKDPALEKILDVGKKVLPALPLDQVETTLETVELPIHELQARVVEKRLDGVLITDAVYNAEGKLQVQGLRGSAEQPKILEPLIAAILAGKSKSILSTGMAPLDRLQLVPWQPLLHDLRSQFAHNASPLLQQTRLDRVFFQYDEGKTRPKIWIQGVCIYGGKNPESEAWLAKWTEALMERFKRHDLDQYELALEKLRRVDNPIVELQSKVIEAGMDGVVFRAAHFDAAGKLLVHVVTPRGQEANVRKLLDQAARNHPDLTPIEKTSSTQDAILPPQALVSLLDTPTSASVAVQPGPEVMDWQQMLADLRQRCAQSPEPLQQQTRIDRAYFSLHPEDLDQPPYLNFKGVCLRTVHDEEKQVKDLLRQELSKVAIPGVPFVLKIDAVAIHDTPIYALQSEVVARRQNDLSLNVLFERATYRADGALQLHVLALQKVPMEKIVALYQRDRPLPAALWKLPDGTMKTPLVVRRDFDWPSARKDLRAEFAQSLDPFLQRSRFDTVSFAFSADRKVLHLHVEGVCMHPPALASETVRARKWQSFVKTLIPQVQYEPTTNGMVMLTNPSMVWQDDAAGQEAHDGILFQLARFDAGGKLKLVVWLPAESRRDAALRLVAEKPVPARLAPVAAAHIDFQVWNWKEVRPKTQARLAQGDFLPHRTRVDRIFFQYELERGDAYLHFDGVSLHPTEVEPAEVLRGRLERSFKDLLPAEVDHKRSAGRIRFLPSPIYALQTEAVTRRLDGLLFADGRYDETGKLHLVIVAGAPEQKEAARKMVEALPMPEGVLRSPDGKDQPLLDLSEQPWSDILQQMQGWLARNNDTLLRKSRLDRSFFSYPASKVGPDLNLILVGIYPKNGILASRLKKRFEDYVQLYQTDRLQAGPVTVVAKIEHLDNLALIMQAKMSEVPALDGVRLDDASFDSEGKLILHGLWNGKSQQTLLEKWIRTTMTPAHVALARGLNYGSLQVFDSPALLHQLRGWVADQQSVDEVWLERLFFDGMGKIRVTGFSTRTQDREAMQRRLPGLLPPLESKKLPAIEGAGTEQKPAPEPVQDLLIHASLTLWVMQEAVEEGAIRLELLPNIADYLRASIPRSSACDGLRIDRCYYDVQGVLRIEGLADREGQIETLKPFLDGNELPLDAKRQLAKGWGPGRITVIALRPMMVALDEALPALPEFDGIRLMRAHHDAKNRLVFTVTAVGEVDTKSLEPILRQLLESHPRWRRRAEKGVALQVHDQRPADVDLSRRLVLRALALLQVTIGEAKVDPAWPTGNGWWNHAWPFDERLPRIRPTDADYDRCLEYLDAALLHNPKDVLAWYLRGYVLQTKNRSDLTRRDFRRMAALEQADRELRHQRILALELVQGRLRQSALRIEELAILDLANPGLRWTLPESPVARDPAR